MTASIKSKSDLNLFLKNLIQYIIFFALIISAWLIFIFLNITPEIDSLSSNKSVWNSLVRFISEDYNFALLPLFYGMVGVLYFLNESESFFKRLIYNLILIIYSVTIILTGSRRGIIALAVIIIILLFIRLIALIRKNGTLRKISQSTKWFLTSIGILTVILIGFVFIMPVQIKRNILNTLGITAKSYKQLISTRFSKYSTILSNNGSIRFQDFIWTNKSDPLYPDSGWDSRTSTLVFPLTGENVEIVPENSIGYKMDSTCNASIWNNSAFSYTDIKSLFQDDSISSANELYYASVYCFVSKDFDGSWARISTQGAVSGKTVQEYDLNKKGVWQKLSICFKNTEGISSVHLYWTKEGVTDFKSLKGHIIFAYPEYRIIRADPNNPYPGWGSRVSTLVFPLTGENVEIVPENSTGYKMDNTCDASTWNKSAYSYTDIKSLFQGDSIYSANGLYYASVYCFVSKDFDGTWARISTQGVVSGKTIQEYDLNRKGIWQKLSISFESTGNIPAVLLYWAKEGVTDFINLKGHIIFAYPQYKSIAEKDSISSFSNASIKNEFRDSKTKCIKEFLKIQIANIIIKQTNGIINLNGAESDYINECSSQYQKKNITNSISTCQYRASLFISAFPLVSILISTGIDKDPLRRWASKLISEDTTYYGYKNELTVDTILNGFISDRIMRWQFAWQIFVKEYNWKQKIFGGGFDFLNWFGYYFMKDKTFSDYPHNPVLYILLYSGILGFIIYLIFMYRVFYYYFKYIIEHSILFILFLITLFFSFFSAGSPFDPPVMGFFAILPFFIHYVNKSED